jgi:hypothetical protein
LSTFSQNFDRDLGYYVCDGISFGSKISACIYAQTVNKPVKWIFKNHIHDRYPWEIEPAETLDQLYDRHCRDLREKYDYIILSYSGGSDTHNILESFARQNLHIDEIVTNHLTKITEKKTVLDPNVTSSWNLPAEHVLQTLPRLKEIQNRLPRTKITVLDVSDAVLSSLDNKDESWVLDRRESVTPGMVFRYNHLYFSEIRKQFDKNLKIGIIVGIEKPRTHIENNVFYIRFSDTAANMSSVVDHNHHTNAKVEYFYWNNPQIMAKQAHVVKRWVENTPGMKECWNDRNWDTFRKIQEPLLKNIIYTTWRPEWFQVNKAVGGWYCELDQWYHNSRNEIKSYDVWKKGVEYIATAASNFVKFTNGYADGLQSLEYCYKIGNVK